VAEQFFQFQRLQPFGKPTQPNTFEAPLQCAYMAKSALTFDQLLRILLLSAQKPTERFGITHASGR
jgi:hypothetical protein